MYGRDVVRGPGGKDEVVPAGVTLIDSNAWRLCILEARASSAAVGGGRLLVYGTRGSVSPGVRFYTSRWRRVSAALGSVPVWDVKTAGRLAYVRRPAALDVLDIASGRRLRKIAPPPVIIDVIARR